MQEGEVAKRSDVATWNLQALARRGNCIENGPASDNRGQLKGITMLRLTISLACVALLAGCISAPTNYVAPKPYVAAPSDIPPALLRSGFPTHMGHHDSMSLKVVDNASCQMANSSTHPVFNVDEFTKPAELDVKPVAMAVDQPLLLQFYTTLPGKRSCSIFLKAQFESGKHYVAYGGNDIHIFSLKRDTCSFTIIDEETKEALPMEQVPLNCRR
jgi:hypothetical protein